MWGVRMGICALEPPKSCVSLLDVLVDNVFLEELLQRLADRALKDRCRGNERFAGVLELGERLELHAVQESIYVHIPLMSVPF
jgi:hypothetical protein